MEAKVYLNVIDEIKDLTASAVSKKQDTAKLNYPTLIEKIKVAAKLGESICYIGLTQMNEYDKRLLEKDGFTVSLVDIDLNNNLYQKATYMDLPKKQWKIKW